MNKTKRILLIITACIIIFSINILVAFTWQVKNWSLPFWLEAFSFGVFMLLLFST